MRKLMCVVLTTAIVALCFGRCSNDNHTDNVDESTKLVRVTIVTPSTYAGQPTAVRQTSNLKELHAFFTDGITIKETGRFLPEDMSALGKTFPNVPGSATTVIIIGNALTHPTVPAITTIAVNDPISKLNALMFQQIEQTDFKENVNLHGIATVAAGTAAVLLTPAIARIEIDKVEAKASAVIPLNSFELAGIYINNTYAMCGTDYSTLPTLAGNLLNYGANAAEWTNGAYPARFKDEWSNLGPGASFAPAGTGKWAYFVMPVAERAGNGTVIDGVAQTSVPHIIVKVNNPTATGHSFSATMYATVSTIRLGGVNLTELSKGQVYSIASLGIGGENLSENPETPALQSVVVNASVSQWIDGAVSPVIP